MMSASSNNLEVRSLNNFVITPVIESNGSVTYKTLKNSMAGHLGQRWDISVPVIIKELDVAPGSSESFAERQFFLRQQLQDITPDSGLQVFGTDLKQSYKATLITGSRKSRVVYLEERIHHAVRGLFKCPEELLGYGKVASTEFSCYGLHHLSGVNVEIVSDDFRPGYKYDGLSFASEDIMGHLELGPLAQFRLVHHDFSGGIAKGVLKYDPDLDLPASTILLTESALKGAVIKDEWIGTGKSFLMGLLRNYDRVGTVKDSWTHISIPSHEHIKEAEIDNTVIEACRCVKIINNPAMAMEYRGILDRDEGFSKIDNSLKVAVGATVDTNLLPPLTQHPYLALSLRDLMAHKLRTMAVDTSAKWKYVLNSATIIEADASARTIKTSLYPVGTKLAVRRYPILLIDSWGTVTGPSQNPQEVELSPLIQSEIMGDHDGDMIALHDCPLRVKAAQVDRASQKKAVSKTHERLQSTWWELASVIAKNVGSSGVGTSTYGMLAAKIAGNDELAVDLSHELQKSVDSLKWSVRADINKCREALEQYGLPINVAHRQDKKQFRAPETTDNLNDPLWDAVAKEYREGIKQQQVLSLSAYQNIFGHEGSSGLSKDQFRHVQDTYRYYCQKVKAIVEIKDDGVRSDKMADLFEVLRVWGAERSDAEIVAAWQITHSQSSKNNRAVFCFEVFGDRLLALLARVYRSEQVVRLEELQEAPALTREQYLALNQGLRGKLAPTGAPLSIQLSLGDEGEGAPILNSKSHTVDTIALVALDGIKPGQLAEEIRNGRAVPVEDMSRPLPAQGPKAFGVSIKFEGKEVAQIADCDIPVFRERGLVGDPICYGKSLKFMSIR
jgi:hypothetical protein